MPRLSRLILVAAVTLFVPVVSFAFTLTRPLSLGSHGSDVTSLQQILAQQGFLAVSPTGYFGTLTQAAVQAYQKAHDIVSAGTPATTGYGAVGPKTLALLNSTTPTSDKASLIAALMAQVKVLEAEIAAILAQHGTTTTTSGGGAVAGAPATIQNYTPPAATGGAGGSSSSSSGSTSESSSGASSSSSSGGGSTTPAADTTPPSITVTAPSVNLAANTTSTTLSASTNENATCTYSTSASFTYQNGSAFTTTGGTSHSTTITGLTNGSSNTYYIKCADTSGNVSGNASVTFSVASPTSPPSTNSCPMGSAYQDGCASAPSGTAQLPTLLNGYATRPAWNVAGVDYYVGYPAGTMLKDPTASGALPSCATVDSTNHLIRITASNCVLNGYDFSLHGGYEIYIANGAWTGTVVENSNFYIYGVSALAGTGDLTVINNTMNGGGAAGTVNGLDDLISYNGNGKLTVEHNYIYNSSQHGIDFGGNATQQAVVEFNVFQDMGMASGSHPDPWYFYGTTISGSTFAYNSIYESQNVAAGNWGIVLDSDSTSVFNTSMSNNVVISTTGAKLAQTISYIFDFVQNVGTSISNDVIQNNYFDQIGTYGVYYPASGSNTYGTNTVVANNIDMRTGLVAQGPAGTSGGTQTSTGSTCPKGTSYQDGCGNAPGGTPQLPNLLDSYVTRPAWNVAGVDYAVGITPGMVLKDPTVDPLPAGVSYNPNYGGGKSVVISGGSNVVLNGWDFTVHGGVNVYVSSASNVTISNSKFGSVASAGIIQTDALSSGITLVNDEFDGYLNARSPGFEVAYIIGNGPVVFKYNYVKDAQSGILALLGSDTLVYEYNVIQNATTYPGEHLNMLEWSGTNTTSSAIVQFNTLIEYPQGGPSGEFLQFYNNGGATNTLTGASVTNNVMISAARNPEAATRQNNHTYNYGDVITVPGSSLKYYRDYIPGTSASTQPTAYATTAENTNITDGTAVFQGTNVSSSYMLHGSNDVTYQTKATGKLTVANNYIDPSGNAWGVYYPGTWGTSNPPVGSTAWSGSNNINMVTGAQIPNPSGMTSGTADTQAPSTPTALTAAAISTSQINLSWTASTDNVGVTGYTIYRNGTKIGTATNNSYSDSGLSASTNYSYSVSAYDAAGNTSAQSIAVSVTTQAVASSCPKGALYADGCVGAPTGTPQFSTLLSSYATRPAWNVPGVDYYVGYPSGTVLKDPAAAGALPSCATLSGSIVYVNGNNCTLNGFDFSLNNGYGVVINGGVSGTTIENSNFVVGSNNNSPIRAYGGTSNLSVLDNTINAGGSSDLASSLADFIFYQGTGNIVVKYNYIYNTYGHMIDFVGASSPVSVTPTIEYNVFYGWGMGTGSHGNPWYMDGNNTIANGHFDFNTVLQPATPPVKGGNPALALPAGESGVSITNTTLNNNVALEFPGANGISYIFGGAGTTGNSIQNNYFDPTGAFGDWYPGSTSGDTIANNINMLTSVASIPSGYSGADSTAPSTPTGLSASAISSSQINLTWTASIDNVGVTGYKIYRGGTQIGTATTNSYSDTGLTASTAYTYTVAAYDAAGNTSAQSAAASATTQAAQTADTTPPVITITAPTGQLAAGTTQTTLSVTTNENATCAWSNTAGTAFASMTQFSTTGGTTHSTTLSGLTNGSSYTTYVKCKDTAGNISTDSSTSYSVASSGGTTSSSCTWARPGATLDLDFANKRFYANGTCYSTLADLKTALGATNPTTWTLLIPIGSWGSTTAGTWIASAPASNQTSSAMGNSYNVWIGNDTGGVRYSFFLGNYFSNHTIDIKNPSGVVQAGSSNDYSSAGSGGKMGMTYDSSGTYVVDSSGAFATDANSNGSWTEASINGDITSQAQYNTSGSTYGINRVVYYPTRMTPTQITSEFGQI